MTQIETRRNKKGPPLQEQRPHKLGDGGHRSEQPETLLRMGTGSQRHRIITVLLKESKMFGKAKKIKVCVLSFLLEGTLEDTVIYWNNLRIQGSMVPACTSQFCYLLMVELRHITYHSGSFFSSVKKQIIILSLQHGGWLTVLPKEPESWELCLKWNFRNLLKGRGKILLFRKQHEGRGICV